MNELLLIVLGAASLTAAPAGDQSWAGLYRKANGGMVGIGELHEFGRSEVLVDYTTGEAGALFELPDGRTGVSHAIGQASPPPAHVLGRKDGSIRLDDEGLHRIPVTRRSFEVTNGPIKLSGELVHREAPKGVIVLIHGSGDGPRRAYDLWTNFFLSRGWAVVVYDKRGSGKSTGDWHQANFIELAGDARVVVRWGRAQPEFKRLPIGLWGASQAGWIIPQLAADGAVDFAIIQAGPATPTDEFLALTLESELRAYGFAPEEIAKAKNYYALDAGVSRGREPFLAIEAAYQKASAEGAEWLLKPPDPAGSPDRRFMAAIAGFDPAPYWRKVCIPMLVLFGGKDHVVPVGPNRSRLEALLGDTGNSNVEIVTLESDNHLNMIAKTGVRTEHATLNRFDPVYFETLSRFLETMASGPGPAR